MTGSSPVEAVIGLGLEVKGRAWDDLTSRLDKHKSDWKTVEGTVERIGSHVDTLSTRLLQLGGAVGIGALIGDFVRLEDQANRVALAIGNVTGDRRGFTGTGLDLLDASKATGFGAPVLGQAVEALQMRAGGTYLQHAGAVPRVARALGFYSGAFSMDPRELGQQIGTLEMFQRQNPGSTPQLLQQIAAQASRAGMAGQTSLFTSTVSGAVASMVGQHPGIAGSGINIRLGALYGAAQADNPAFRDPGTFGQALQGIDSAVTNAYTNPRLQAVMQMSGIGYWDQRGGLAGPHGPAMARKLLAWSAAQYGQGTVEQDMFLRSNFGGNVSADFLQSLARKPETYKGLVHAARSPQSLAAAQDAIRQRSEQYQATPGAAAQRGRSGIERELYGLFGNTGLDILNFVGDHPIESIAGAYGAKKGLGALGRGASSIIRRRWATRTAARAAAEAAAQAGGSAAGDAGGGAAAATMEEYAARAAGSVPEMAGGFYGGAAADSASAAAGGLFSGGIAALGLRLAGATVGTYAGFMLFPDSTQSAAYDHYGPRAGARRGRAHAEQQVVSEAQRKFGPGWWTNPKALAWTQRRLRGLTAGLTPSGQAKSQKDLRDAIARTARAQAHQQRQTGREGASGSAIHDLLGLIPGVGPGLGGLFGLGAHALEQHGVDGGSGMLGLIGKALHGGGGSSGGGDITDRSSRRFDKAVDKFEKAVAMMFGGPGGMAGAAYHGGTGGLNAAGLAGGNDAIGSSMILARAISGGGGSGGGSGGSGMSLASFQAGAIGVGGGGGGGGGRTGPGAVSGGGWRRCTLTWYDPGLGGINSSHGQKDPHALTASGEPYDAKKYTCAASSKYSFGTLIAIRSSKGTCTVKVNDRGGAVQGDHFDLSRAAWAAVGATSASFKVVGHAGSSGRSNGSRTTKAAAAGGGDVGASPIASALAWQAAGGQGGGGGGGGVGGGGGTKVDVHVDGRRVAHLQHLTRGSI